MSTCSAFNDVAFFNYIKSNTYRAHNLTIFFWSIVIIAYLLKFIWKAFDKYTNYGKLDDKQYQPWILRFGVSDQFNFTVTYGVALIWNSLLIALRVGILLYELRPAYESYPTFKDLELIAPKLPFISLLYQIQICRRLCECVLVHKFSGKTIRFPLFIFSITFYIFSCLTIMLCEMKLHEYNKLLWIIGGYLFLHATWIQFESHIQLASIREAKVIKKKKTDDTTVVSKKEDTSTTIQKRKTNSKPELDVKVEQSAERKVYKRKVIYGIPRGGWFDYVSCPHYMAEIVIYAALLIITKAADSAMWFLFAFVALNLTKNAIATHAWYKEKFGDKYPKNRKALIPFVL